MLLNKTYNDPNIPTLLSSVRESQTSELRDTSGPDDFVPYIRLPIYPKKICINFHYRDQDECPSYPMSLINVHISSEFYCTMLASIHLIWVKKAGTLQFSSHSILIDAKPTERFFLDE